MADKTAKLVPCDQAQPVGKQGALGAAGPVGAGGPCGPGGENPTVSEYSCGEARRHSPKWADGKRGFEPGTEL